MPRTSFDRWVAIPASLLVGVPTGIGVINSFVSTTSRLGPVSLLLNVLGILVCLFAALNLLGVTVLRAYRRAWRAAFIGAAVLIVSVYPPGENFLLGLADYVHFLVLSPRYLRLPAGSDESAEPRLQWFYWIDNSDPLDGETLVYLAFDEADGFSLPAVQRSSAWEMRARKTFMSDNRSSLDGATILEPTHHLFGHYYVVRIRW